MFNLSCPHAEGPQQKQEVALFFFLIPLNTLSILGINTRAENKTLPCTGCLKQSTLFRVTILGSVDPPPLGSRPH